MNFVLQIAHLAMAIEGPEPWVAPLAEAWDGWRGADASFQLTLIADAEPPVTPRPLFQVPFTFTAGVCRQEAPGFVGSIDPVNRQGVLRAHPQAGAEDAAYFVRAACALTALQEGALLFHATAVVHREEAYAFFGLSGSGKTTVARLSRPRPVLNDDLVLLYQQEGRWRVHATPFGLRRHPEVMSAPLRAFLRLRQALEDRLAPLSSTLARVELLANSPVVNADPLRLPQLMALWDRILTEVPAYALYFRKSPDFWEVMDAHFG